MKDPMEPTAADAQAARVTAEHVRHLQPLTLAEAHAALNRDVKPGKARTRFLVAGVVGLAVAVASELLARVGQ